MSRKRIWIPEAPVIQPAHEGTFKVGATIGIGGIFHVELLDAKTGEVLEEHTFPNLITDSGMDAIAGGVRSISNSWYYLAVGTDNTTPTHADTSLGAEISRTNSNGGFTSEQGSLEAKPITGSGGWGDSPYYWGRQVRVFTEGEANGNLTELGWFNQSTGGTMVVRSLFKNSGGTPITITKTSANQLKVTYEHRLYPPVGNSPNNASQSFLSSGTVVLGGTTHHWTSSVLNLDNYQCWGFWSARNWIGSRFGSWACETPDKLIHPTGTINQFSTGSRTWNSSDYQVSYVAGTSQSVLSSSWAPAVANYNSGISGFAVCIGSSEYYEEHFQIIVSESIMKTNLQTLNMEFTVQWDRAVLS